MGAVPGFGWDVSENRSRVIVPSATQRFYQEPVVDSCELFE